MPEESPSAKGGSASGGKTTGFPKWCWWGCLVPVLLIVVYIGFMVFSEYSSNKKSNATAPDRTYVYHSVSSEVKNRTIDCMEVVEMSHVPKRTRPLCLNLYQTNASEINEKLKTGLYDTVLLYGEKIFFEAEAEPQMTLKNYGQTLYDTAKFTDQITMPKLMALYGLKDLSYMNINPLNKKIVPYDGLYMRLAHATDTLTYCDQVAMGCAGGWYGIIIPEGSMAEHSFDSTLTRANGDTETVKSSWPKNCYTDHTFLHEISHTMTYSSRVYLNGLTGIEVPTYVTEYIAGLVGREGPEFVCGKGTVSYESVIEGKKGNANLVEFNSVLPPVALSHHHPEDDCNLAVLTLWNQTMAKDWPANFTKFFAQNREDNKQSVDHGSETAWGQFVLDFAGTGRDYLNSHGCSY